VGGAVEIVDPGPAIARQTGRVIANKENARDHAGHVSYFTSGDLRHFQTVADQLMGISINPADVHQAHWTGAETVQAD